jgi:hypothetical protein
MDKPKDEIEKELPRLTDALSDKDRRRVEQATVRLVKTGSRGVLAPGEFIFSATHCIPWRGTGTMALGEVYPIQIETASGVNFRLGAHACDPVADIAALGELDNQQCPDDADHFKEWRGQVEPVPLCYRRIKPGQVEPVFIYTHKDEWIEGSVTRYGRDIPYSSVALSVSRIESGTSGSPVVTADGLLLGIVSHDERMPVCAMAVPRWVLDRVKRGKR